MVNQRHHSQFSHLLHRLRYLVGVETHQGTGTGVNRRNLSCANGSDIQLEFDLIDRQPPKPARARRELRVPPPPRMDPEWSL